MKKRVTLALCLTATLFAGAAKKPSFDHGLPVLGTKFHQLPDGPGKAIVESACFRCHSADILVQQRLAEKQWNAEIEKMARWGAPIRDADKPALLAYLTKHFGPGNTRFRPLKTRPVGY